MPSTVETGVAVIIALVLAIFGAVAAGTLIGQWVVTRPFKPKPYEKEHWWE